MRVWNNYIHRIFEENLSHQQTAREVVLRTQELLPKEKQITLKQFQRISSFVSTFSWPSIIIITIQQHHSSLS
jgi:hypothetical protein